MVPRGLSAAAASDPRRPVSTMLEWLSNMQNTKPLALVIFFVAFVGVVLYVFTGKKRSKRLESYKNIPFEEDDAPRNSKDKGKDNG